MKAVEARAALANLGRDLGGEPAIALLGATAALMLSHYQGSTSWFGGHLSPSFAQHPAREALAYFWWFGASVVLYFMLPLCVALATRSAFTRRFGLGVGDARAGLTWTVVLLGAMVPVVCLASRSSAFQGAYPLAGSSAYTMKPVGSPEHASLLLFAAYEAAYVAYFVSWEFLFRGWMLNALLPRFGRAAVLIQTVPFALMHLGKPEVEALGSIIAGIALGVLALRTRSFWYGAILHGGVAVFMDVLSAAPYLGTR